MAVGCTKQNLALVTLITAVASFTLTDSSLRAQSGAQVVASGLDNPRGLTFGPDGALYVVEAGRGGASTVCGPDPAPPPGRTRCYAASGAVTRVTGVGVQQRVVTGLPSLATAGGDVTGPHDIDFGFGQMWVTIGFGGDPVNRAVFQAAGGRFGGLVRIPATGGAADFVVDISAQESASNPDGGPVDSNPYGLDVLTDGAVVADPGANALFNINVNGQTSTLAVFPRRTVGPPIESVPTTVVQGPDGNLYVGELTGAPFPVGSARVYRVPRSGGTPVVVASGFTNIIDIAFGPNNTGYVLEYDADGIIPPLGPGITGRLTRFNSNGTQTVVSSSLIQPGGVTVGPDGAVYVTNRSNSIGAGEVVRIPQ